MKRSLAGINLALSLNLSACGPGAGEPRAPEADRAPPKSSSAPASIQTRGEVSVQTELGLLRVEVLESGMFKTRLLRAPETQVRPSWALDPKYVPQHPTFRLTKQGSVTTLSTEEMSLRITEIPFSVEQRDAEGEVVFRQDGSTLFTGRGARLSFRLAEGESVFGLGDKARGMNRRGESFEMWNTDAFAWKVDQDPLYKTFPVFVFLGERGAHGLFVDSPSRAKIDVGKSDASRLVYDLALSDAVDLYFLAGPRPEDVLESYTVLTGRPYLPPLWSLGYHQSRYGYKTEREFRALVKRFRKGKLPLDVLWFDIDYQKDFAPFTVDSASFEDFGALVTDLKAEGVQPVCITDLHIKSYQNAQTKSGYGPFETGARGDHFLKREDGSYFEGKVWPDLSVFPEFTRARTRHWWGELYREFVSLGVSGFWNDMNEPALFNETKTMPEEQMHRMDDGSREPHTLIHNAYGALNVQATFEGVKRLRPGQRPFVLTRAAFSGSQRYSASWTGDNVATREHLAATIPTLSNLGVSGYPNIGADVGGFEGCPSPELLAEWMELGAFQPFFRNHSGKGTCLREPWVHGDQMEARMRRAIERRYIYLPYLYTVFEEASRTGHPVMRPLWYEHPEEAEARENESLFYVGEHLLVAPKLTEDSRERDLDLPAGDYFRTDTGEVLRGSTENRISYPEGDSILLFARAGAIIPTGPVLQHTGEGQGGSLTLHVFPGEECRGEVYTDDGVTYGYQSGNYRRLSLSCAADERGFSLNVSSEGEFVPWWKDITVALHGTKSRVAAVETDQGVSLTSTYDARSRTSSFSLPNRGESFSLQGEW